MQALLHGTLGLIRAGKAIMLIYGTCSARNFSLEQEQFLLFLGSRVMLNRLTSIGAGPLKKISEAMMVRTSCQSLWPISTDCPADDGCGLAI